MIKIYIILPVYNRREITRRFILCLQKQTYKNFHLLLIDDGSTDNTSGMVMEYFPSVTVLRGNSTWWWGGSLHQGYKWIKSNKILPSDVVLIINDDDEFDENFLQKGINLIKSNDNSIVLAKSYCRYTGEFVGAGVHLDWQKLTFTEVADPGKINCFSTKGLFINVNNFIKIGGFYPKLIPHYLSDYEYTVRAYQKGFKLIVGDDLALFMDKQETRNIISAKKPFFKKYFSVKSTEYFPSWFFFIFLRCPWKYKLKNFLRISGVYVVQWRMKLLINRFFKNN